MTRRWNRSSKNERSTKNPLAPLRITVGTTLALMGLGSILSTPALASSSTTNASAATKTSTTNPSTATNISTTMTASTITVNGQTYATHVPVLRRGTSAWIPLETVIRAMTASGIDVTYDGKTLLLNNLAFQSASLLGHDGKNTIAISSGTLVMPQVRVVTVKTSSGWQQFVPVQKIVYALTQGNTGFFARWRPGEHLLSITNQSMGAPSTEYILRVMANTTEVTQGQSTPSPGTKSPSNIPLERFSLSGQPVTVTMSNGDTVTACVGTRSPSADGYGQVVFFFHNQEFVGLDSPVEKSFIQSIKPAKHGTGFNVTYWNYAKTDPMVKPSLPPVTVTYSWDGTEFTPTVQGQANTSSSSAASGSAHTSGSSAPLTSQNASKPQGLPPGVANGLKVRIGKLSTLPTVNYPTVSYILDSAKSAILQALKPGDTLIHLPGQRTPYLPVNLGGNVLSAYAAAYKEKSGPVGLIVVGLNPLKGWQVMFHKVTEGAQLKVLQAGAMTGDGTDGIVIETYVGDGANDVYVLKEVHGTLKPVLHKVGLADVGNYAATGNLGPVQVQVWTHDTGPMENVQMYAWNSSKNAYLQVDNRQYPQAYGALWAYDEQTFGANPNGGSVSAGTGNGVTKAKPSLVPKMADAMWSQTYLWMGDYTEAQTFARQGLSLRGAKEAYPPNAAMHKLLHQATVGAEQVTTYGKLPKSVGHTVDVTVAKYNDFLDPVVNSTPLVSSIKGGYAVTVYGSFLKMRGFTAELGSRLTFKLSSHGSLLGPVVLR